MKGTETKINLIGSILILLTFTTMLLAEIGKGSTALPLAILFAMSVLSLNMLRLAIKAIQCENSTNQSNNV